MKLCTYHLYDDNMNKKLAALSRIFNLRFTQSNRICDIFYFCLLRQFLGILFCFLDTYYDVKSPAIIQKGVIQNKQLTSVIPFTFPIHINIHLVYCILFTGRTKEK